MPEGSGQGGKDARKDAKKLIFTFEVSVLDKGGDGWEARCDDGDLHITGVESQRLLVERVKEHFLKIGDEMGPVGDRVLFNLLLDCADPDAAAAREAEPEPAEPDGRESEAAESRQDRQPEAEGPKSKGATLQARFAGFEGDVEDLRSRIDDLEDEVEDLQSRIDGLETALH